MAVFDIIIPSYNNKKELINCLQKFSEQTFTDFRIFVCIDGSTDYSAEAVRLLNPAYPYFILEHPDRKNQGRNATRNLALKYIQSEFLLFFDSDITPYPELLEKHYELLKEKKCISVGNVEYLNKNTAMWAAYISSRGYNKFNHLQEMPYEYMNMGNVSMPSHFFTDLNGMDSNLRKYGGDDTEFSIRLDKTFKPVVINNAKAKGFSILNKTLEFAFSQIKEFGQTNLNYIHTKHPGFGHIFAYDLMRGSDIKSKLYKSVLTILPAKIMLGNLEFLPTALRLKAIHILTAYYLYKGFKANR